MHALEAVLADHLRAHSGALAGALAERIRAEIPSLFVAAGHPALARAGVEALLRDFEIRLRYGDDGDDGGAPTAAVAFARDHARRGTPLADVLRSYQVGQQATFDLVARTAATLDVPAEQRAEALARVGRRAFAFADAVMSDVARAFEEERERRVGRLLARREALVADLLAGRPVDRDAAEPTLGYRLDGQHVALVALGDDGPGATDLAPVLSDLSDGRALQLGRRA